MNRTEKIKDKLSNIAALVGGIWLMLAIPLHVVLLLWLVRLRFKNWLTILTILVIWWTITLVAFGISKALTKRKNAEKAAQEKEYRDKYITPVPVNDYMLGVLPFEKDSCTNTVKLRIDEFKLFDGKDSVELTAEVTEDKLDMTVEALRYIYSCQEKLMMEVYEYTVECMDNYGEVDADGKPCGMEFAKKNMAFFGVDIMVAEDGLLINLAGSLNGDGDDMLGGHWIIMDVDYPSKKTDCYLEG